MSQKKITYIKLLHQLEKKMKKKRIEERLPIEMPVFQNLLTGVPSILKGYHLLTLELGDHINLPYLKKHLLKKHEIKDRDSAMQAFFTVLGDNTQAQYEQFLGFWKGQPETDLDEFDDEEKLFFESCKTFAKQFYPFLNEKGFAGFDYGEAACMVRESYACGFLDKETAETMLRSIGSKAFCTFDSWEEYAISFLCGSAYSSYFMSGLNFDHARMMFETVMQVIETLFFTTKVNVWNQYAWPLEKKYFPDMKETRKLIDSTLKCFATDRISIDGLPIGSLIHNEPAEVDLDSGWMFFAGDESKEYINDLSHTHAFSLNTLCNYDESIIPLLDAPVGTIFYRGEDGEWVRWNAPIQDVKSKQS